MAVNALNRTQQACIRALGGIRFCDTMNPDRRQIARCLQELAVERGAEKTFCPSEAARRLVPDDWRRWMEPVREEAARLVGDGKLRCTQRGREVDPETARGALRFSLPQS